MMCREFNLSEAAYNLTSDTYKENQDICLRTQITSACAWALALFFFILAICSCAGCGRGALTKFWLLKFLGPPVLLAGMIYTPEYIFDVAAYVAGFFTAIAFAYLFIGIINFAAKCNTAWEGAAPQDPEHNREGIKSVRWVVAIFFFAVALVITIGCALNDVFLIETKERDTVHIEPRRWIVIGVAIAMLILTLISVLPFIKHGSLLVSCVVMALVMSLVLGLVIHNYDDNHLDEKLTLEIAYMTVMALWFLAALWCLSTESNLAEKKRGELFAGIDDVETTSHNKANVIIRHDTNKGADVHRLWTALYFVFCASIPLALSTLISDLPHEALKQNFHFWIYFVAICAAVALYAWYLLGPTISPKKKYFGPQLGHDYY